MEKEYICECGKVFKSQKSLSAHMASCKEHYLYRDGNLENYYKRKNNHKKSASLAGPKISEITKENWKNKKIKLQLDKDTKLEQWLQEEHRCENCGKVMTEFYGSGRFCSKSCANSRNQSNEIRDKIRNSIKTTTEINKNNKIKLYYNNPNHCSICGKILNYKEKNNKTCSIQCRKIYLSNKMKGKTGGYRHFSGHNKENKGYYKGIYCDSTWELAYVIYNLDHNIPFKRCTRVYKYKYNGKIHNYHPDFELEDGTLIEIKGYEYNDSLKYKIDSVKDRDIQILRYDDLENIFKYVIDTYGKDFKKLYDK